jgi:tetratricopeptide (TPR) repeat protein
MYQDARGLAVSLRDPAALESYERSIRAFQTYRGDPVAPLDEALVLDPGFAAAAVAKALILLTFFERRFAADAAAVLERHRDAIARGNDREKALAAAAGRIARGEWEAGVQALERILVDHPRDAVALQVAHLLDFCRGDSLNLRNRLSRVMPHWSPEVPGHAYVLGMHAFGLEECNQYPEAEAAGRRALEASRDDCWAVHAVAHVMEMQGRIDEGAAWLEERRPDWATPDNGFAFHNTWHLALFHLDRADTAAALAIHDEVLAGATDLALTRVDGTALLWRLRLEGADVGDRFAPIADAWEAALGREGGYYAFNDFHAALAFAAAGRGAAIARLRAALNESFRATDDNGAMTRAVGLEACEAAIDYCEGRYGQAARRLEAIRDIASRFGGSHAQRDLLTLTLVDAATRAGDRRLAAHYVAERLVHRPASAWGHRLLARTNATERLPA